MIAESPANKGFLRPAVNWGLVELTVYDPTPSGGGAGAGHSGGACEGYAGVHFGAGETTPAPAAIPRRSVGGPCTLAWGWPGQMEACAGAACTSKVRPRRSATVAIVGTNSGGAQRSTPKGSAEPGTLPPLAKG